MAMICGVYTTCPARRRFQRGQLTRTERGWTARFREDVINASGGVERKRRKQFLGTHEDYPTKRLAMRALEEILEPINRIYFKPLPTLLFSTLVKHWLEKVMPLDEKGNPLPNSIYEASSIGSARSIIRAQLLPSFGAMKLKDIRLDVIQGFVSSSRSSPKTVRNIISVLMVIWDFATACEYVTHNPFPRGVNGRPLLKMPKGIKGKTYAFTLEETLAIIEKAPGPWKVFFRLLAETGIRPGELAGLRMSDLDERSISIERSIWRGRMKTPKTQNGIRRFPISESLAKAIRTLEPGMDGHLFVTPRGKVMSTDHLRQRVLEPILEELGIRAKLDALGIHRCGAYPFRHFCITEHSRLGVPEKTTQQMVGHAVGSTVTRDHYIHPRDADALAAAEKMGSLLTHTVQ